MSFVIGGWFMLGPSLWHSRGSRLRHDHPSHPLSLLSVPTKIVFLPRWNSFCSLTFHFVISFLKLIHSRFFKTSNSATIWELVLRELGWWYSLIRKQNLLFFFFRRKKRPATVSLSDLNVIKLVWCSLVDRFPPIWFWYLLSKKKFFSVPARKRQKRQHSIKNHSKLKKKKNTT